MNNIVKIKETEILIKEFRSQRVVTSWDIANVHNKEVREINQIFKNNQHRFIVNKDYFSISINEIPESFKMIQKIPNNVKEIFVFTESGYLLLTKPFTDDLSWEVQRQLVESYFTLKVIKTLSEKQTYIYNIIMANDDLSKAIAINEYEIKYVKPLEKKGEYVDNVLNTEGLMTITTIAKDLGMSGQKLNKLLNKLEVIYKKGKQWYLYSKYESMELAKYETVLIDEKNTVHNLKWTEKGRKFIIELVEKENKN